MDERISHELADHHLRHKLHFLAQRVLDDLVLRQLPHDEAHQALKAYRIALGPGLVESGVELRRSRENHHARRLAR